MQQLLVFTLGGDEKECSIFLNAPVFFHGSQDLVEVFCQVLQSTVCKPKVLPQSMNVTLRKPVNRSEQLQTWLSHTGGYRDGFLQTRDKRQAAFSSYTMFDLILIISLGLAALKFSLLQIKHYHSLQSFFKLTEYPLFN